MKIPTGFGCRTVESGIVDCAAGAEEGGASLSPAAKGSRRSPTEASRSSHLEGSLGTNH